MIFLGHDNPSVAVTFLFRLRGMLREISCTVSMGGQVPSGFTMQF